MAVKKSAAKRHRQSIERRMKNRIEKSKIKSEIKSFLGAVESKEEANAQTLFLQLTKTIDTAAKKGVLHKNTAARKKSRLAAKLNGLKG